MGRRVDHQLRAPRNRGSRRRIVSDRPVVRSGQVVERHLLDHWWMRHRRIDGVGQDPGGGAERRGHLRLDLVQQSRQPRDV